MRTQRVSSYKLATETIPPGPAPKRTVGGSCQPSEPLMRPRVSDRESAPNWQAVSHHVNIEKAPCCSGSIRGTRNCNNGQTAIMAQAAESVSGEPSIHFQQRKLFTHSTVTNMLSMPQWLQFAELFDYVDDVRVWVKDRDGRFFWVNRAVFLKDATNAREGDPGILGQTDYDRSPAFHADQYRLDDEYVLAGNRIINRIELIRQPDGTTAWHVTNKIL